MAEQKRFPNPLDLKDLPGTEGWREMYPYYYMFSKPEERPRTYEYEQSVLWFYDSLHYPYVVYPFDLIWDDMWHHTASAWVGRIHVFPDCWGRDHRIVNGRPYICSSDIKDPQEIEKRVPICKERVNYVLENFEDLYAKWRKKVEKLIRDTDGLVVPDLPDLEPMSVITEGGYSTGHDLIVAWNRLMEACHLIWEWHFEFNNLVSFVNVEYFTAVRKLFPGITDKTITSTCSGFESMMFQPTKRLIELAQLAIDSGLEDVIGGTAKWADVQNELKQSDAGNKWLEKWEEAQEPWFNISCASGWYHSDGSWNTDPDTPLGYIREYITKLKAGKVEVLGTHLEEVLKERDRVTEEYRSMIKNEDDRKTFDKLLKYARKFAIYPEDHDFYVENWAHTVFYKKVREFGRIMVKHGVIKEVDDIFLMTRFEIPEVLHDIIASWYSGVRPVGQEYWPPKIARRKEIMDIFSNWRAPEAFGPVPDDFTNPVMINEYGWDMDTIKRWYSSKDIKAGEVNEIKGYAGSSGIGIGTARVCLSVDDLKEVQEGDVLVAPATNPAWSPCFSKIKGIITDVGGVFGHAAIVAREHKVPAVVATGIATKVIKTGDKVRVDGDNGVATIINE